MAVGKSHIFRMQEITFLYLNHIDITHYSQKILSFNLENKISHNTLILSPQTSGNTWKPFDNIYH